MIYLASDDAREVTGQCYGVIGYSLTRFSHIVPERVLIGDRPWTVQAIAERFKSTLGTDLKAPGLF